ncbi:hypothetical protein TNCV_2100231 [Trichonephila clavipes]|nr:hypothetical protein TNCV_2100231 [Trichonephila clavipes]
MSKKIVCSSHFSYGRTSHRSKWLIAILTQLYKQRLRNRFCNIPPSIKCRKLILDVLKRLDASNPTALRTTHATGSSVSNESHLKTDSDSKTESIGAQKPLSVADELEKVIKEVYAPMQSIRFETLSSKIQKEMSLLKMD